MVNLDIHECTCRKWMLTRIPCCHVLSAMKFVNVDPVNFIPFWYKKETYAEVYNSVIYPLNGEQVWERNEMPDVVPPPTKKMPKRPKQKRRLESWEVMKNKSQLGQTGLKKKCEICHKLGHNRKSCIEKSFEQSAARPSHPRPSHQRPSHTSSSHPGPSDQGPSQATPSAPSPYEQGTSQATPSAPSPYDQGPSQATPSASGPSQEAPSQTAPTTPPTQPKVSQPSQAARRTTRSSAKFSRPNTRLKLQSMRGRFWKP